MIKDNWNVYCTRFLVRARQLTGPISFTDPLGHEHVGRTGDYLVETSNGMRRIATKGFFEDTYVPLAPAHSRQADLPEPRPQGISTREAAPAASAVRANDVRVNDRPRAIA